MLYNLIFKILNVLYYVCTDQKTNHYSANSFIFTPQHNTTCMRILIRTCNDHIDLMLFHMLIQLPKLLIPRSLLLNVLNKMRLTHVFPMTTTLHPFLIHITLMMIPIFQILMLMLLLLHGYNVNRACDGANFLTSRITLTIGHVLIISI